MVGTGQSGCQIAEDLHLAGRKVHLATGSAPRVARFYRGRDCVAWLSDMGTYTRGVDEFDNTDAVRFRTNHYVTGRDGGRDIDLRRFALEGMALHGRLSGIANGRALANDQPQGFAKILADPKTDKLLGAQIIGFGASELIPEAVTILEFGGSAEDLGKTVHAHPTMSEAVKEAALAVHNQAFSIPPR